MDHAAKILIVEDQYFVAIDDEMTLDSAGFDCVGLATNAEGALALAREKHPDLIIMDIRLVGRADGVKAATDIYRELGIRSIFASGHADAVVRQQAQDARPLGWLDKPYSSEQLLSAVKAALMRLEQSGDPIPARAQGASELH
jgi:DNA-binding NarL/FixJ family response regulator